MVRLRVISLKDTYNKIFKLFIYVIIIFTFVNICKSTISNDVYDDTIIDVKTDNESNKAIIKEIIDSNFLCFKEIKENEKKIEEEKNLGKIEIIKSLIDIPCFEEVESEELVIEDNLLNEESNDLNTIENIINKEQIEKENIFRQEENIVIEENLNDKIEFSEYREVKTSVVPEKNKVDKYTTEIHGVKIRNESKYVLNANNVNLNYKIKNKENVIIYHTHTCESYTATEKYNYIQTGNYRSTDLNFTVSKVGDMLTNYLKEMTYNVSHLKKYHDYPAYNGSYDRARETIEKEMENFDSDIVLDIHRDAMGDNSSYGPTILIGDEKVAQLMIVIGTNGGGLKHDNWIDNLNFAVGLQKKAEELYPGFFKPIIVRNARYNQHVSGGAVIIEVGATGNTLEEAEGAMKYLSIVLDKYIKENN